MSNIEKKDDTATADIGCKQEALSYFNSQVFLTPPLPGEILGPAHGVLGEPADSHHLHLLLPPSPKVRLGFQTLNHHIASDRF